MLAMQTKLFLQIEPILTDCCPQAESTAHYHHSERDYSTSSRSTIDSETPQA